MYAQWKSRLAIAGLGAMLVLGLGACEAGVTGLQGEAVLEGTTVSDDGFEFGGLDGLQRLQDFREMERKDEDEDGPGPVG